MQKKKRAEIFTTHQKEDKIKSSIHLVKRLTEIMQWKRGWI